METPTDAASDSPPDLQQVYQVTPGRRRRTTQDVEAAVVAAFRAGGPYPFSGRVR